MGIADLPVADEIKTKMENAPLKGKLVSLIIEISESAQIKDVLTLISYKKGCK